MEIIPHKTAGKSASEERTLSGGKGENAAGFVWRERNAITRKQHRERDVFPRERLYGSVVLGHGGNKRLVGRGLRYFFEFRADGEVALRECGMRARGYRPDVLHALELSRHVRDRAGQNS